jgi:hypothetical protein
MRDRREHSGFAERVRDAGVSLQGSRRRAGHEASQHAADRDHSGLVA